MLIRLIAAAALLATPAFAQDKTQDPPKRIRNVLLFGEEACPKPASEDEIVVCAKTSESPYRIPKEFRGKPEEGPAGQAWSNRMEYIQDVNRAGLPNSCSPVGTGGQTGCSRKFIQQWAQDKIDRQAKANVVP